MKSLSMSMVLMVAGLIAVGTLQAQDKQADSKQEDTKQDKAKQEEVDLKTLMPKVSYLVGRDIARQYKEISSQTGVEFDIEQVIAGLREAAEDKESSITDEEAQQIMTTFQRQMQIIQNQKMAEARKKFMEQADKNLREGDAFLKKNSTVQGVKQFESGLQMQTIKEGTGASPKSTDVVKIKYKGSLIDGTVFDQTEGDETTSLVVSQFIKGFSEGLMNMKVGGKAKFFIPGKIGYGMNVRPGSKIGPNSTLVFEVELVEIIK